MEIIIRTDCTLIITDDDIQRIYPDSISVQVSERIIPNHGRYADINTICDVYVDSFDKQS